MKIREILKLLGILTLTWQGHQAIQYCGKLRNKMLWQHQVQKQNIDNGICYS